MNRPFVLTQRGEQLFDFVKIEQGQLQAADADVEPSTAGAADLSLRVRDSSARVEVIGKLYVEDRDPSGGALLSVMSSHSGERSDRLSLTVSLFNFLTGSYDAIGTDEVPGGGETLSQFRTRLDASDPHVGERGEIQVDLSVSPGNFPPPAGGYTYAIDTVSLRLRDEG